MASSPSSWALFRRMLSDFVRPYWLWLVIAFVFLTLDGLAYGLIAAGSKYVFDSATIDAQRQYLVPFALAGAGLFMVRAVSALTHRSILRIMGLHVVGDMQERLMAHLFRLDVAFFNKTPPGELIERVRGDSQTLQMTVSSVVMVLGRDGFSAIALIATALYADWRWTIATFIGIPLIVFPVLFLQSLIRRAGSSARGAAADLTNVMDEAFHGHKSVRVNARQDHEVQRSRNFIRRFIRKQSIAEVGQAALPSTLDLLAGIGIAAVLIIGMGDVVSGRKTLGDFAAFGLAFGLLFDPLRRLAAVAGQIQIAGASLERLFYLFDQKPSVTEKEEAAHLGSADGATIEFEDVHFGYDPDKAVLKGLSFEVPPKTVVAFVGATGAGKSTLFNLICRFYDPQAGRITIDGQDIRDVTMDSLRQNLALVSQETALFNETLGYNMAYGCEDKADDHQALQAVAQTAHVTDFSEDFGQRVGPRGESLSGGQRQRVVIARALMRDAPILLLDEATSALDRETERNIQEALNRATKGRTTLIIAHRLSTIQNADIIYVLDKGRIAEKGTHNELLAKRGLYSTLAQEFDTQT